MKNNKMKVLLSLVLAITVILSSFVCVYSEETIDEKTFEELYMASQNKRNIASICSQIASNYYYGALDEDLLYRALCSAIDLGYFDFDAAVAEMMDLLEDEYSEFFPKERFEAFYQDISGEFFGIGVSITLSGDYVVVANVFPDSPAEKSGILPYDTIISVDGKSIEKMSTSDVAALIKREKGQKVIIGIIREGKMMSIECYCDEVNQNPISYEILEDSNIGYIYLSSFSLNLDEFLVPILKEFEEKGIKDIILDIRNNSGGEVNAAIALANHFIPEGTIAKFKYKNEQFNKDLTVENDMKKTPYNMVLLVNENSASASELFAGAVKDRDAGTVIGTQTYGKGSMQSVHTLHTGSAIKYTIAEFHSPLDNRIHTIGITPDYIIENSVTHISEENFAEIDFAKKDDLTEGDHILAIEQRLNALGYLEAEADSVCNDETIEAIKNFQMGRGLNITGETDVFTLVALVDIIYEFDIVNDDQLEAAIEFLETGRIKDYKAPEAEKIESK